MIFESPAFVLHRQNYGETSRIVRCLTRNYGRVDLLCKGCRSSGKRSRILEPFRCYHISWSGKGDLKTIRQLDEITHFPIVAFAERLYCGFYINELLSQTARYGDAEPEVFDFYSKTLEQLVTQDGSAIHELIRSFELSLLQYMGYGITLDVEKDGVTPIEANLSYGFEPDHGLYRTTVAQDILAQGDSILALGNSKYENSRQAREAKYLMRAIIGYYLPNSSIQSRKLFASIG